MRVFTVFLSDIIFPSVFTSHSVCNSWVSEVSKIILTVLYDVRNTMDGSWKFFILQ